MGFQVQFAPLAQIAADWLVIPLWDKPPWSAAVQELDAALGGLIRRLYEAGDLPTKAFETVPVLPVNLPARRLLFVGLGPQSQADRAVIQGAAAAAARAVTTRPWNCLALAVPEPFGEGDWSDLVVAAGVGLAHGSEGPGLRKKKPERYLPENLLLVAPPTAPAESIRRALRTAEGEARAVSLARELVNTPPCDLYPETFAQRAQALAAEVGLTCTVWDERQIAAERCGALLGVAQGSDRPPRLVFLRYHNGRSRHTLGWVGKGVTFDSGGLSLKTNEQMVDMKCDMAGAAAVLAACFAVADLQLPVNLLAVLPLVENLPSGRALKLGDVLRARNGMTIEVLNTDAEGRLILADALCCAVEEGVSHLVDLATLTGACLVALGTEVAGLMSNDEAWSARVQSAARQAGEKVWPLPMFPLYAEALKSSIADLKNTPNRRYAGAIVAAKFLEAFVAGTPWVHLDIAGPAWAEQESPTQDAGGTGAFVRTLIALARAYEEAPAL